VVAAAAPAPPHDPAEALRRAGRLGAAEGAFRSVLASHPGDPAARYGLARTLLESARYREAASRRWSAWERRGWGRTGRPRP
jgi:thioredoxin-like negative regulator of GroEL